MSMSQTLAPHLPYLRRYARALTGSQPSGDAHVRAALAAILAGDQTLMEGVPPRVGLYRIFHAIWQSGAEHYDEAGGPQTGKNPEGRKVKGVIHWVPAAESVECEVRLYDRLFRSANPEKSEEGGSFLDNINPDSLVVLKGCRAEPSLASAGAEDRFQFEREGYFCADSKDSKAGALVFNRTVTLRDSWGQ